jgi:cytochrome c-type biogenesis protein CcmH
MKKTAVLFLILSLAARLGTAAVIEEDPVETKTREIAKTLRCAVCQSESVWESNATLAQEMRDIIRDRVRKGQSADEIRAYFLSRYGDYILLKPTKRGMNGIIWFGPFVLLLIGGALLYRTLSRWVAQTPQQTTETLPPLDEADRERLTAERHSREEEEMEP